VAQALQEADPTGEVALVGRRGGVAEPLVTAAGLRLESLDIRGVDVSRPLTLARAAWQLPAATLAADRILRRFGAEVVVGTGGYVCVPVVAAATARRVPVVLLEQNAVPGRATRLLARRARVVATSFAESAVHLRGARVVMTGNPIRREVLALVPAPQRERCTHVLVMGGSQGARTLNRALAGCVRDMLEEHGDLQITHQCGALDWEDMRANAASLPGPTADRYHVAPFFADMAARIAAADLVLMRAGGSSLAECSALGRALVLVPYPHAGGHQLHNVRPYVAAGAATQVPDSECTPERVRSEIGALLRDQSRWRAMSAASRAMGRPDAADVVVRLLTAAVSRSGSAA
jgi:UDP-N-acetylglucosamine--N-acetylmuramyl-(pentapeptide) pyrophosphoryl-undecaprenol N-acetylglucosamine transferase